MQDAKTIEIINKNCTAILADLAERVSCRWAAAAIAQDWRHMVTAAFCVR
jgi:hypothetical protein